MNELSTLDTIESSLRERIDIEELREARRLGWLIEDPDRRRARYFDGRFLAAPDLTRDQRYFLSRQLDLGRASGGGVIQGLELERGSRTGTLLVAPGHGVTPAGDSVLIRETVTLDVMDVPTIARLDATFGLEVRPRAPVRNISGLFVIALRNVEYTANPVATYPRDLQVQRRIEDGEIIEATAITLIPFESVAPAEVSRAGQARLAREIFVRQAAPSVPAEALPIGVVALRRGAVEWVDRYLVRRDASVDDSLGFGLPHRAVREAFLRQYQEHLDGVAPSASTAPVAASDHFEALPAFGPLPRASLAVEGDQLVQTFFPPELRVELTILPRDELAALQEESIQLPPIDLRARAALAEATSVQIFIPVPRADFAGYVSRLEGKLTRFPLARNLRPRARKDLNDTLIDFRERVARLPQGGPVAVNLAPWDEALRSVGTSGRLFYARRRALTQVAFSLSRFQTLPPDSPNPSETLQNVVLDRLVAAEELPRPDDDPRTQSERLRFDFMLQRASSEVLMRVEALLSRALFAAPLFVNGVVAELAYRTRIRLDDVVSGASREPAIGIGDGVIAPLGSAPVRVRALRVSDVERVRTRYTRPSLGGGLSIFSAAQLTSNVRTALAESFRIPELDEALRQIPEGADRQAFAAEILASAQRGDIGALRDMVDLQFSPADVEEFLPIPGFPGSAVAIERGEGRLYALIHAFAAPTIRTRLNALFDPNATPPRPNFAQPVIVSMVLAEFVVHAWQLALQSAAGGHDFNNLTTLLGRIANWDQAAPLDFNLEDLTGTGSAQPNLTDGNGNLTQMFTRWETLEAALPAGALATLPSVLESNGFTMTQERFRILGLAGDGRNLARRILAANSAQRTAMINLLNTTIDARGANLLSIVRAVAEGSLPA